MQELQQTQTQLLQDSKLKAVGQLAAGIAHEINTPAQFIGLNVDFLRETFTDIRLLIETIVSQLEVLGDDESVLAAKAVVRQALADQDWEYLVEEIPAAIDQSREGIGRISTIVQAMKDFAHPKSRDKEKYDLNKIIETTIVVASNEWKYSSEMRTDLDPDLPQIVCLVDELGQVFLNMIVNAAHANEEQEAATKGAKGIITVSTRRYGDYAVVRISDTGKGMATEVQQRIFEPFFTTKPVGKGSGQGLAIAHNIITQKHGGTIDVSSEPGKGATFSVRLPID